MTTIDPVRAEVRAAAVGLLLAALDYECIQRRFMMLHERPQSFVVEVCHEFAHLYIEAFDESTHRALREQLAAEALDLRGQT